MFKIPSKNLLNNKSVLITGGTGSLGIELTSIFLKNFNLRKIIILSRDELKQSEHNKKFNQLDNGHPGV
jgi:UDP-N-acetylglucosamine 4,6-dehydratase